MKLQHCTWMEVEQYLEICKAIVIPIGSAEQHGPNGLIGTDAICPEIIAEGVAQQVDIMVAPTISVGMAQHHLAFPGSIALQPSTLMAVISDYINSLMQHGFKQFYFLNGHGGNVATVSAAFSEIHAQKSMGLCDKNRATPHTILRNWYSGKRLNDYSKKHFARTEGSHATVCEVSLTYYAFPDCVKNVAMSPKIAPTGLFLDAEDFRSNFPDGRIGSDPSLATIAHGEQVYTAAVADTIDHLKTFLAN